MSPLQLCPYDYAFTTPIQTAQGRFTSRKGWHLLLRAQDSSSWNQEREITGIGDIAPWPGFGASSSEVLQAFEHLRKSQRLDTLAARLSQIQEVEALPPILDALENLPKELRHGLELAALNHLAQRQQKSLASLLCAEPATRVTQHAQVADLDSAKAAAERGFRSLKLKIAAGPQFGDQRRLLEICSALPDVRLRLDANGGWTLAQAADFLTFLSREGLPVELMEQPLPAHDLAGMRALRSKKILPGVLALDEGLGLAFARSPELGEIWDCCDGLILKPMFLGGLLPSLEIARRAASQGRWVLVTNALESVVGRAAAGQLAAALPAPARPAGLGTLLREDLCELDWLSSSPEIQLPRGPDVYPCAGLLPLASRERGRP
jgi:o-succinylbenzoate synthase